MSTSTRLRKRWIIALAVTVILALTGCQRDGGGKNAIRIAAVAPTTGSQAETGQDLINGIRQAVDEKNAAGGVLGKSIELLVFDDTADPKEAVSVAHKIAGDSTIVGVVGHMNSGTAKAASPIYSQAGIPMVMPVPTNPDITKQGFTNLFRVPPTDLDQGTDVARYAIERLGKKRFAIVHDSTAYGQPLAEVVRQTVKEAGGAVLTFDGINEGDKDFRALLTRIRAAKPDVLFFGGIYNEAGLLAKQANELGIKATFLAADGSFGQKFIDIAGAEAAEGAVMTFIAPDEQTSETMRAFSEKFRAKHGNIKAFAPLGYDAANILLAGIAKAGNPERASVIAALHSLDFEYSGVTGKSRFESNGNNLRRTVFFFQVRGGRYQAIAH